LEPLLEARAQVIHAREVARADLVRELGRADALAEGAEGIGILHEAEEDRLRARGEAACGRTQVGDAVTDPLVGLALRGPHDRLHRELRAELADLDLLAAAAARALE